MSEANEWKAGWERNFETAIKAIKKLSEDVKQVPSGVPEVSFRKLMLSLELLEAEVDEARSYMPSERP